MQIPSQEIRDVSEGIIQRVDERILPPNSVALSVNVLFDNVIGRATIRPGLTQLGGQIVDNKTVNGLFLFKKADGTKHLLAVVNNAGDTNAGIYSLSGSNWGSADTTITASTRARFVTYLDTVSVLYGDVKSTADGTTWVTTGGAHDTANFPDGRFAVEFKDRIYAAGVAAEPDRLYYSSLPNAGAISWTVGNGFIDVEPEEGTGAITALSKVPGYVLIFKERSFKRWDGQSTFPESMLNLGTSSQESVVIGRQSVFFFNSKGIWETTGGYPRKISRRVQDIIEAISSTYYDNVSGWCDGDRVFYSIGDVTVYGISISNAVLCYSIDSQNWALFSFPTEMSYFGEYIDSNNAEFTVAGDDDGNVWKFLSGVGDNNNDINWMIQFQTQEWGTRGRLKEVSKFVVYTKDVRNGVITVRSDLSNDFKSIGTGVIIKDHVQEVSESLEGRYFDFRIRGAGKTGHFIGLEFPVIDVKVNYAK